MMKNKAKNKKTNNTAVRALEMLKLLTLHPQTKNDIVKYWQENEQTENFNTDNLYKYFNTFKLFGLNIKRTGNQYSINENFINMPMTEDQEEALIFLSEYAKRVFNETEYNTIKNITDKLCGNIDNIELKTEKIKTKYAKILNINYNKDNYTLYKDLCNQKQRINIKYRNKQLNEIQQLMLDPQQAIITPRDIILRSYNPSAAETQDIYSEDIVEIKQLPIKSRTANIKSSVTFKITGRLAMTYDLKNGERIIEATQEYKTITNSEEDKEHLVKRLLRYGTSCEIIYPKSIKQKALNYLHNIKKIYK